MTKRLREDPIYLAPNIYGYRDFDYNPVVIDEKTEQRLNPNSTNDKIKIYERQVNAWFLERASKIVYGRNNGFVVLMIATSYIEGVQQYIEGRSSIGQSKNFFRTGIRRIFQLNGVTESSINDLYSHLRCGLFHNGMSGDPIVISPNFILPIDFSQQNTIQINPRLFLSAIKADFVNYVNLLRDENNIIERAKFDRMFIVI